MRKNTDNKLMQDDGLTKAEKQKIYEDAISGKNKPTFMVNGKAKLVLTSWRYDGVFHETYKIIEDK